MNPLDIRLITKALTMAERTTDESSRSLEAAEDYLQQVQERYGEDSDEFREADNFCRAAHALDEGAKKAAAELVKSKPTTPA